jgi:aldose 1-epimerase
VPLPVDDFSFAGSTIAPWPNRLEDATWFHEGKELVGVVNEKARNNALHGLTVRSNFELVSIRENSATFGYLLEPSSVYPFSVELLISYDLDDSGLSCTFTATNRGSAIAPIAYASHPYFGLDADSRVLVSASKATINSARALPIGERSSTELGFVPGELVPVSSLSLDDCLMGFPAGKASTVLTRPSIGRKVTVWQCDELDYMMMFTRRPAGVPELLAIEPQSAPANAFRSGEGLVWLEPGESVTFDWGVSVS